MTEKEEKIAMIPSAIEDSAAKVSDDDLRLFSRYLAACQGAPATIQPEAVRSLCCAVERLLDATYSMNGDAIKGAQRQADQALRLYHGDES